MDILQTIATKLPLEFYSSVVKHIDVFRRSLLVKNMSGQYGLSTNCGEVEDRSSFIGLTGEQVLSKISFSNNFHRSIFIALLNSICSQKENILDATKQKAHRFVYSLPKGKSIAVIGRFPFVGKFRDSGHFSKVSLFELDPRDGELGTDCYPELASYDVIFITAMTLVNNTFDHVVSFCSPQAKVILLGPTTPMLPVLLQHGVNMLAGAVVIDGENLKHCLSAGNSFRASTGLEYLTISRELLP